MGPNLSIIILNYNVKDLLLQCLESVFKSKESKSWQVIVVDNGSTDGSIEALESLASHLASGNSKIEVVKNEKNLGFAAGNNVGVKFAKAPVVLFLNPDTVVMDDAINQSLKVLESNPDIGALTCRVELPDGKLDYSCHRGFPTPWNSFCYFSGLAKAFPKSKLFASYTATYLDIHKPHEIDCATGAFLMVRKIAGMQINWWDEDYFWNGEDIEFCYQLKMKGWKVYYYPDGKIIHYKGSSAKQEKGKTVSHGISAMKIFFMKHYYHKYPPLLRDLVLMGINILEKYRKYKRVIND